YEKQKQEDEEKKENKQNTFYLVVVINKNLYNFLGVREITNSRETPSQTFVAICMCVHFTKTDSETITKRYLNVGIVRS
uniref:Uncharacterized protein n=1 Tax=Glossina palpalis gambiensis TaxID=67801 RepID=A0A1B0AU45_9MUSC